MELKDITEFKEFVPKALKEPEDCDPTEAPKAGDEEEPSEEKSDAEVTDDSPRKDDVPSSDGEEGACAEAGDAPDLTFPGYLPEEFSSEYEEYSPTSIPTGEEVSPDNSMSTVSAAELVDYFEQLVADKRRLDSVGNLGLTQVPGLLELEIERVRQSMAHLNDYVPQDQPEEKVTVTDKIWVPTTRYPEYNFAGRILGPRGMTVKQMEQETGCRIQVRGKGSMKHQKGDDGKDEDLHVIISIEEEPAIAKEKIARARAAVKRLITPSDRGMDELKRKQLMELAIINGNYRPSKAAVPSIMPPIAHRMPDSNSNILGGNIFMNTSSSLSPSSNHDHSGFNTPVLYSLVPSSYLR